MSMLMDHQATVPNIAVNSIPVTGLFVYLFIYLFIYSFIYSFICVFVCLFIYLFIYFIHLVCVILF